MKKNQRNTRALRDCNMDPPSDEEVEHVSTAETADEELWQSGHSREHCSYRKMVSTHTSHSLLVVALTSLGSACGGSAPKAQASVTRSMSAINPKPDDDATRGNINVSDDVRKACSLNDTEAYFAFDSSHVRAQDKQVLRTLADCFMSGPLKGREMSLNHHRLKAVGS